MRTSAESDRFMAGSEIDIEPCNKSVDEIVTTNIKLEWRGESEIFLGACVEIEGKNCGRVGNDSLNLDGVDERFGESGSLERRIIEAINVVPDFYTLVCVHSRKCSPCENLPPQEKQLTSNLLILIFSILNTSHEDSSLIWENQTIWRKVLVSSVENGIQHGFIEQEVTHPFRDDDVNFWEWKYNLLHLSLKQCNLVGHAVDFDNLTGLFDDGGHINTDNVFGAGLDGEPFILSVSGNLRCWKGKYTHAENGGTASYIKNNLVLEKMLVLHNSIHV